MIQPKSTSPGILIVLSIALIIFSLNCRKIGNQKELSVQENNFFLVPPNASAGLKMVISELKRQDNERPLTAYIAENFGVPFWDKAISNENFSADSTLYFIPLREKQGRSITAIISCIKTGTQFHFKMLSKRHLERTIHVNPEHQSWIRGNLTAFAYFEQVINGVDSLRINGFYNKVVRKAGISFETDRPATGRTANEWTFYWVRYCESVESNTTRLSSGPYYCWDVYSYSYGGSNVILGSSPVWYDNLGGGGSGSIGTSLDPSILLFLSTTLELNETQSLWLLQNPLFATQVDNYLKSFSPIPDHYVRNAKSHIEELMTRPSYSSFVQNHIQTSTSGKIWWEDNNWLDNPDNFNFDIDHNGQPYKKLTAAEKALIALHPINAARINANVSTAFNMTSERMGPSGGLNDKKDAFRHAFFNAINTRDCTFDIGPPYLSATMIVRLFAQAHESEVPSVLNLEKQMDLYNNEIGIDYCRNCFTTSSNSIADAMMVKVNNGLLRYLKPLNFSASPNYDANGDGIQDCSSCLNGITNSSVLTPTNQ